MQPPPPAPHTFPASAPAPRAAAIRASARRAAADVRQASRGRFEVAAPHGRVHAVGALVDPVQGRADALLAIEERAHDFPVVHAALVVEARVDQEVAIFT